MPSPSSIFPSERGFHSILKFGSILILYGGKEGNGANLNDMWKFSINTRSWIPLKEDKFQQDFYLYRSNFIFTKFVGDERPVIYGGENRNKKITNDLIKLDFDICLSDTSVQNDFLCIPCSEGYILNFTKNCIKCPVGTYHAYDGKSYLSSKCENCPVRTFNPNEGSKSIANCKLCGYGYYNSAPGQQSCTQCNVNNKELCLPGSIKPIESSDLVDSLDGFYLKEENFPDFIGKKYEVKENWEMVGLLISVSAIGAFVIVLCILYHFCKKPLMRFFIVVDFIPITGGTVRKLSGGVITIVYSFTIIILIFTFIMRFLYYNELVQVNPISSSHTQEEALKSSYRIHIDLFGYEFSCIDPNQKIQDNTYLCANDISIFKINSNGGKEHDLKSMKSTTCQDTVEGYCRIQIQCENCKSIVNGDTISVRLNNKESYVQLFKWSFESVWGINLDYQNGYSKLDGIFKPDKMIE